MYVIEDKLRGKLEKPIQKYEDFERLLLDALSSYEIGHVDILSNLLPKNRQLIKDDISTFETQLKQNIEEGKFAKLELYPTRANRKQQYKIVE